MSGVQCTYVSSKAAGPWENLRVSSAKRPTDYIALPMSGVVDCNCDTSDQEGLGLVLQPSLTIMDICRKAAETMKCRVIKVCGLMAA